MKCLIIKPNDGEIPQTELGAFVRGYKESESPIKKKSWTMRVSFYLVILVLIWLGVYNMGDPGVPTFFFVAAAIAFCVYLFIEFHTFYNSRVFIYSNGFLWQDIYVEEHLREHYVCFDDVKSIVFKKTRNYENKTIYTRYTGTDYSFKVENVNGEELLFKCGTYKNENDVESKFDWELRALNDIYDLWTDHFLKRLNSQLERNAYISFPVNKNSIVQVSKTYIRLDDMTIEQEEITYCFDSGNLYIRRSAKDDYKKSKKWDMIINVNKMENKMAFLIAIKQLLGIDCSK